MSLSFFLLVVAAAQAAAAQGPGSARILIVFHSESGNTEKLARAVRDGAARAGDVEVVLRKAEEAQRSGERFARLTREIRLGLAKGR